MVDLIERLDVLLYQEEKLYNTVDYLDPVYQKCLLASSCCPLGGVSSEASLSSLGSSSSSESSSISGINESWREKIVEWSYQVTDHFDFSRFAVSM